MDQHTVGYTTAATMWQLVICLLRQDLDLRGLEAGSLRHESTQPCYPAEHVSEVVSADNLKPRRDRPGRARQEHLSLLVIQNCISGVNQVHRFGGQDQEPLSCEIACPVRLAFELTEPGGECNAYSS